MFLLFVPSRLDKLFLFVFLSFIFSLILLLLRFCSVLTFLLWLLLTSPLFVLSRPLSVRWSFLLSVRTPRALSVPPRSLLWPRSSDFMKLSAQARNLAAHFQSGSLEV